LSTSHDASSEDTRPSAASSYAEANDDAAQQADGATTVPTPRWVKVSVIATLVLIVLIIVMLLVGGHGPSRH
jgi:hypothetical protein